MLIKGWINDRKIFTSGSAFAQKDCICKATQKKIHYCRKSYTIHADSSYIQWLLPTGKKKKTASVKRWKVLDPLCQVLIFLSYFVHHCYLNLAISLEEH